MLLLNTGNPDNSEFLMINNQKDLPQVVIQ